MKKGCIQIPTRGRTAARALASSVSGAALIEYALLAALIAVAVIAATRDVGGSVDNTVTRVDTNMRTATMTQFQTP